MKTSFNIDSSIKLNNGELVVIASRPAMGKTTFALNILSHIGLEEKIGILFFSLEDSEENIIKRLVTNNSITEELLKDSPIYLSTETALSIEDICKKSRKLKDEKNIEVIIIDYLQLINFDKQKLLSRDDEITEILRRLKVLAKELDIPVIITSQLSRAPKERRSQKPIIEDFSSSKYGITKYSDKILFLYRDLNYTENEKNNIMKLTIAKNNDGKIKDLEIILKIVENGILKEKISDDYELINSKAISNYCRNIMYQFNTEELAVLVYRNKKMDIFEKVSKYEDLIDNYSDMEVIERINCKHYDSVKTLIQEEIDRLKNLFEDFIKEDERCAYTWYEYNKTTKKEDSSPYHISKNLKGTYKDVYDDVVNYVNEYDDTISFTIIKKFFGEKERTIISKYNVINKKIILINIYEDEDTYLDINNIFVYMPTPFKKGDILISKNQTMSNIGDNGNIFVLDNLITWSENIKECLAKGNYDSSDMVGYGYYLYDDKAKFTYDNKWDYDSFEYYEGDIEGNNRILKQLVVI